VNENPHVDEHTGVGTTGHEWDGIRELDNPLPRWWLIVFWATAVFAVGYWIFMPSWPAPPGFQGFAPGILHNSQRLIVQKDLATLKAQRAPFANKLASATLPEIEADPALLQFALAAGESAFANTCAPCHGAGAQGARGYPNLNDDDWLWGGKLADIRQTILHGVRAEDDQTRQSLMPAFGRDGLLQPAQINDLVEYVRQLSGQDADAEAVKRAAPLFAANCVACHGAEGKGNRELGAPNLTDGIWLYGSDRATIRETITNARRGVMPAWSTKLDPATIAALAVFVHQRGGGE
jgi:cytochrome c oxidase cbb3-type subunit III